MTRSSSLDPVADAVVDSVADVVADAVAEVVVDDAVADEPVSEVVAEAAAEAVPADSAAVDLAVFAVCSTFAAAADFSEDLVLSASSWRQNQIGS